MVGFGTASSNPKYQNLAVGTAKRILALCESAYRGQKRAEASGLQRAHPPEHG